MRKILFPVCLLAAAFAAGLSPVSVAEEAVAAVAAPQAAAADAPVTTVAVDDADVVVGHPHSGKFVRGLALWYRTKPDPLYTRTASRAVVFAGRTVGSTLSYPFRPAPEHRLIPPPGSRMVNAAGAPAVAVDGEHAVVPHQWRVRRSSIQQGVPTVVAAPEGAAVAVPEGAVVAAPEGTVVAPKEIKTRIAPRIRAEKK